MKGRWVEQRSADLIYEGAERSVFVFYFFFKDIKCKSPEWDVNGIYMQLGDGGGRGVVQECLFHFTAVRKKESLPCEGGAGGSFSHLISRRPLGEV